ncbi:MAG: extracellular solute-binding protein [Paenibacillaceae bacterium]|nr:extracellular solute-binding protein [Paenibacillaceae bacterium]
MAGLKRTGKTKAAQASLLAALALTTAVAGCSSGSKNNSAGSPSPKASAAPSTAAGASTAPSAKPDPTTELTIWMPPQLKLNNNDKDDWVTSALIPEWNKLHPTVKIKAETLPWEGINEKVSAAMAAKTTPNIIFDYGGRVLPWAQLGAIEPLNDALPKDDLAKFKSNAMLMKMTAIKDDIMVMPYPTSAVTLMINKSLWTEANAANLLPQDEYRTWTPDQFKAALKAVTNKDKGVFGATFFALNEQGDQLYNNMIYSFGAKLFNDDYTKYVAAEDAKSEDALKFIQSLVDEGVVTPHPETISAVNAGDYFKQRKQGVLVASGATYISILQALADGTATKPIEPILVNFPSTMGGKSALKIEYGNGAVFKSSDPVKVEWSKKFLTWMYTETTLPYQGFKNFNAFGKDVKWTAGDKELEWMAKLVAKGGEWPVIDPGYGVKGFSEMRAAMFPEMQKMFIKQATPRQTLDTIAKKNNDIIAKYNK